MASTAGLGNDALELVDLLLGTAEGAEPLLRQLAGTLVAAVAEQLDDTALVRGKAVNFVSNGSNGSAGESISRAAIASISFAEKPKGIDSLAHGLVLSMLSTSRRSMLEERCR